MRSAAASWSPFRLQRFSIRLYYCAGVAELADALDSKSSDRKVVEVQVLSPVLSQARDSDKALLKSGDQSLPLN